MLYTLSDAQTFCSKFVDAGKCPSHATVTARINEAIRRLLVKADWHFTRRRMRFYVENNTITLPREAERVLNIDIDRTPRRVFGRSYEFLENGPGELCVGDGYGNDLMDLGGHWPIFFDIPHDASRHIIAMSTSQKDFGKTILVQGRNSLAEEIYTGATPGEEIEIGLWTGGVEGSITEDEANRVLSDNAFKEISYIKKPVTEGYVCLYTYVDYDADSDEHPMYFLGKYGPDETIPAYRRYRITAYADGACPSCVLCDIKMRYVPAKHSDDILLIQNLDAIKLMCMAIREENEGNVDLSAAFELKAVRLLEEQQKDHDTHDNTFQVQADEFGIGSTPNII